MIKGQMGSMWGVVLSFHIQLAKKETLHFFSLKKKKIKSFISRALILINCNYFNKDKQIILFYFILFYTNK